MSELTIGDLLKAFEKLRMGKVEGEREFWPEVEPPQEEYEIQMVDRKAEMYPLNMWDEVE